jgi:ABC-2 type transport system permease protein
MSYSLMRHLVLKDWYFQRWAIAAYLASGALALVLMALHTQASFYAGTVLLLTVMITLGVHLAIATVVGERTEHTLAFVMSLPISPADYTTAKIAANLSIFLVPWTALSLGTFGVLTGTGVEGTRLMPFVALVLMEIVAAYCLLLAVAIITESLGWTVGVMMVENLFLQGFLYAVSHHPSIAAGMKGTHAVWDGTVFVILSVEILLAVSFLGLAFVFQARKRDFV